MRSSPFEYDDSPARFKIGDTVSFYDNHTEKTYKFGKIVSVNPRPLKNRTSYRYEIHRFGGVFRHDIRQTDVFAFDLDELINL